MKVLLSVRPEYAEKIFSGEKQYEYRRRVFREPVDIVVIYSTQPEGRIVGHFNIARILHSEVDELWRQTGHSSGLSYARYCQYFHGQRDGYALAIRDPREYDDPVNPRELLGNFHPPQSFQYLRNRSLLLALGMSDS